MAEIKINNASKQSAQKDVDPEMDSDALCREFDSQYGIPDKDRKEANDPAGYSVGKAGLYHVLLAIHWFMHMSYSHQKGESPTSKAYLDGLDYKFETLREQVYDFIQNIKKLKSYPKLYEFVMCNNRATEYPDACQFDENIHKRLDSVKHLTTLLKQLTYQCFGIVPRLYGSHLQQGQKISVSKLTNVPKAKYVAIDGLDEDDITPEMLSALKDMSKQFAYFVQIEARLIEADVGMKYAREQSKKAARQQQREERERQERLEKLQKKQQLKSKPGKLTVTPSLPKAVAPSTFAGKGWANKSGLAVVGAAKPEEKAPEVELKQQEKAPMPSAAFQKKQQQQAPKLTEADMGDGWQEVKTDVTNAKDRRYLRYQKQKEQARQEREASEKAEKEARAKAASQVIPAALAAAEAAGH